METKLDLILERLGTINERLMKCEETCRLTRHKVNEFGILLKRGSKQNLEMLRVCQQGYYNVLRAQQYCAEKTDEIMEETGDLSNCISNLNWTGGC